MKLFTFNLTLFLLASLTAFSQDEEPFKPSGKIIARSFLEYNAGLSDTDKTAGFDITRAIIGYNYQITPTLNAQIVIDGAAGRTAAGRLETHLRNAFINWKDKGFDINVGQIGLLQFSLQERYWRHRYVMRSFQDLNSMAPSIDFGATVSYQFNSVMSADISITNGEGSRNFSANNSNRYGAGITLSPIENIAFRIYADIYNDSEDIRDPVPENSINISYSDQKIMSFFAGYDNDIISGGAEYNYVLNKGMIREKDYYGYSFYASGKVAEKWRIFARYDLIESKKPEGFSEEWNDDGQLMMTGIEFTPLKEIKIAPNIRNINPHRGKSKPYFFINVDLNL